MTSIEQILSQMPGIAKPQRNFLVSLFGAYCLFQGRANMTNLHRYGAPSPRTQSRWHRRRFDFADFNLRLLEDADLLGGPLAVAIDATFIPKSGKRTFGLANFWDSSQDRAHKGLELSLLALVSLQKQPRAWPLHARQTAAQQDFPDNRTGAYIKHLRSQRHLLPGQVRYVLADSLYANFAFVSAVLQMDLHLISKLRRDADLRYLYQGEQSKRGRKKQYDGKVDFEDWSRWEAVDVGDERIVGYSQVVNHASLRCNTRVVVLFPKGQPQKRRVLMCTDPLIDAVQVLQWYKARFQIEFVFRDAKQHTGLRDGQMRSASGLDFHFNSSLSALNTIYAQEQAQRCQGVLSMASFKRRKYNELLIEFLFSELDISPTSEKAQGAFSRLRNYGVIAS